MKLSVLQENLAKGLGITGKAVGSRSTLPVLSNVLLRATADGFLALSGTNLEVSINCRVGARVEEPGDITVPMKLFSDVIGAMPADRVDLALDEQTSTLNVKCGRFNTNVKGIPAQEFPDLPEVWLVPAASFEPDDLRGMLGRVTFSAASDESRPILTGVNVHFEGNRLTLATADGFRLSVQTAKIERAETETYSVIVPARVLDMLAGMLSGRKEPVTIHLPKTGSNVQFLVPGDMDVVLTTQVIEGRYPNYSEIIPAGYTTRTVLDTAAFIKAAKVAALFAKDSADIAVLDIHPGADLTPGIMIVSARSAELGDNVSQIDAAVEGPEISIAFNVKYMIDALAVMGTAQVALETGAAMTPGVLRPVGDGEYKHVIMPIHLSR